MVKIHETELQVYYNPSVETKRFIFNYFLELSSIMLAYVFLFNFRGIFMYEPIFRLSGFGGKDILILRENTILYLGINKRKWFLPAIISHFDDREHS